MPHPQTTPIEFVPAQHSVKLNLVKVISFLTLPSVYRKIHIISIYANIILYSDCLPVDCIYA